MAFSKALADEFNLGYAPRSWDSLLNHLRRKKVPVNLIEKAGLVIARKDRSGFYDRFRDRIIFPIVNMSMQTVGFGGRVMDDSLPKYLNSPETELFHKGRELYGLFEARRYTRDLGSVFVVEGYMDVVALAQYGITNAVATISLSATGSRNSPKRDVWLRRRAR